MTPAYGQFLSDATGLANQLDVQIGEHNFEVKTVSNFDIPDFEFDGDEVIRPFYETIKSGRIKKDARVPGSVH